MTGLRTLGCIGMCLLLLGLTGCIFLAGSAVGLATYAFISGEGTQTYNHDVVTIYDVSLDALDDMGLAIGENKVDTTSGIIKAARATGENVTIKIERLGPNSCKVKIRVGILGNDNVTRSIFAQIDKRLRRGW